MVLEDLVVVKPHQTGVSGGDGQFSGRAEERSR